MYKKMVQDAAEAGGGTAPAKIRHALKQDEWIVARFWVEDTSSSYMWQHVRLC